MRKDTWEARMAARAAERRKAAELAEVAEIARRKAEEQPIIDAYVAKVADHITLAEAKREQERVGCACIGTPPELRHLTAPPCWCALNALARAKRLEAE